MVDVGNTVGEGENNNADNSDELEELRRALLIAQRDIEQMEHSKQAAETQLNQAIQDVEAARRENENYQGEVSALQRQVDIGRAEIGAAEGHSAGLAQLLEDATERAARANAAWNHECEVQEQLRQRLVEMEERCTALTQQAQQRESQLQQLQQRQQASLVADTVFVESANKKRKANLSDTDPQELLALSRTLQRPTSAEEREQALVALN